MKNIDKIMIGTHNGGKFKEICDLLPRNVIKVSPQDLILSSPEEKGETFKENSKIKAKYFSEKSKDKLIALFLSRKDFSNFSLVLRKGKFTLIMK